MDDTEPPDLVNSKKTGENRDLLNHNYSKPNLEEFKFIYELTPQELERLKLEQIALDREWKARQLKWGREYQIPRNEKFCPWVVDCYNLKKADKNCFMSKMSGCEEFINYLENEIKSNAQKNLPHFPSYVIKEIAKRKPELVKALNQ